jgi:formylglycine-generating enzyme required for sulfatase activity
LEQGVKRMKYLKAMGIAAFAISLLFLTACGGGDDKKKEVKLILTPGTVPVVLGQPAIFTVGTTNTDFSVSTDKAAAGCVKTNATTVTCTPTAADTYTLTVTATADSKVTAKATLTVSELSVSVELSSTSETVVVGQSTSFTITTENTDFEISTSPATGAGCVKANSTLVTCTPTAAGSYTLTVTPTKDATKAKTANITATPIISVSVSTSVINGIPGLPATFTVTAEGSDYEIIPSEGIDCEKDGAVVTCTPSAAAEYVVTIKATADAAKTAIVTITCTGPAMAFVEVGAVIPTFKMGCVPGENGAINNNCISDSKPMHNVKLSTDFYIGKYEVTQAEWKAVMGADDPVLAAQAFLGDNLPVTNVSWLDITNPDTGFIVKLNAQTGRTYRLPTEAEWEYAARGGKNTHDYRFSGSGDDTAVGVGWYYDNVNVGGVSGSGQTYPVGQLQPNELGVYDMSGNVQEWVQDYWGAYSAEPDPQEDPHGPETGVRARRVVRGGSWANSSLDLLVWARKYSVETFALNTQGFRLAMTAIETSTAELQSAKDESTGFFDGIVSGVKSLWNSITK